MEIRAARIHDARAIAEAHQASWLSAYGALLSPEVLAQVSVDQRATVWADRIPRTGADGYRTWVADEAGTVGGPGLHPTERRRGSQPARGGRAPSSLRPPRLVRHRSGPGTSGEGRRRDAGPGLPPSDVVGGGGKRPGDEVLREGRVEGGRIPGPLLPSLQRSRAALPPPALAEW